MRYFDPKLSEISSNFVPTELPWEAMLKGLAEKQASFDKTDNTLSENKGAFDLPTSLYGQSERAKTVSEPYKQKYESLVNRFQNNELNPNQAAKELVNLKHQFETNPEVVGAKRIAEVSKATEAFRINNPEAVNSRFYKGKVKLKEGENPFLWDEGTISAAHGFNKPGNIDTEHKEFFDSFKDKVLDYKAWQTGLQANKMADGTTYYTDTKGNHVKLGFNKEDAEQYIDNYAKANIDTSGLPSVIYNKALYENQGLTYGAEEYAKDLKAISGQRWGAHHESGNVDSSNQIPSGQGSGNVEEDLLNNPIGTPIGNTSNVVKEKRVSPEYNDSWSFDNIKKDDAGKLKLDKNFSNKWVTSATNPVGYVIGKVADKMDNLFDYNDKEKELIKTYINIHAKGTEKEKLVGLLDSKTGDRNYENNRKKAEQLIDNINKSNFIEEYNSLVGEGGNFLTTNNHVNLPGIVYPMIFGKGYESNKDLTLGDVKNKFANSKVYDINEGKEITVKDIPVDGEGEKNPKTSLTRLNYNSTLPLLAGDNYKAGIVITVNGSPYLMKDPLVYTGTNTHINLKNETDKIKTLNDIYTLKFKKAFDSNPEAINLNGGKVDYIKEKRNGKVTEGYRLKYPNGTIDNTLYSQEEIPQFINLMNNNK